MHTITSASSRPTRLPETGAIHDAPAREVDPSDGSGQARRLAADVVALYRANTADAYRRDLTDYFAYCQDLALDPLTARPADIAGYLTSLELRGLAPSTIDRRLATLRTYYRYACEDGHLDVSPAQRLRYRYLVSPPRRRSLTRDQLTALLAAADAASPRTGALVWLLALTGLRVSEACRLTIADLHVDTDGDWLQVTGKGRIRREVRLHPDIARRVQALIGVRTSGFIFATRTARPLDRHNVARTLAQLAAAAGLDEPVRPHDLRRTFITLARQTGAPLADIQDAVGHADPATTRRYDQTVLDLTRHPATRILAELRTPTRPSVGPFGPPAVPSASHPSVTGRSTHRQRENAPHRPRHPASTPPPRPSHRVRAAG